ncbi:MAG: twin-arginine translocase TatA/TatE family subunit [Planctomycetota bacterium]|nr:twin-arginine translocase TatA/TatE family subunit [Planctomycetota bacterium]
MISWAEVLVIMFIALLVLGGAWIPKLARRTGKAIHDFKDAISSAQKEITSKEEKK